MTQKWPTIAGSMSKAVTLLHAQAWAGNPDLHAHAIAITFGWRHEINPHHGHTWSVCETQAKIDRLCDLIDNKNFNDLIPAGTQPTVETLACWLLVRAPSFYEWIEIEAYGNYRVRVERGDVPKTWVMTYLGNESVQGLTA